MVEGRPVAKNNKMANISLKFLRYALKQLARLIIWYFNPQIIAVTGSAGKTSTKEAIYAVLKDHHRVRKSAGNLNNELGLPLTIIGDWSENDLNLVSRGQPPGEKREKKLFFWLKVIFLALSRFFFLKKSKYPEVLILEYAADRPGDIKYLLEIARPQIGIITAISEIPVHVEFFSGQESVAKEKSKIIECLPAIGFAVLNFDNEIVMKMKERTRGRIITFGFGEGADVRITNFENRSENNKPLGISFKIEYGGSFVPVVLKDAFGKAQAYAAAIAACVGLIFDLNLVEISEEISANYHPAKGRMNLVKGIKDTHIIDDTYNASPISMHEALDTLRDLQAKRKIAVLGDMLELGKYSIEAHESIGQLAGKIVDILVTVGPRGKFIAESAQMAGLAKNKILSFDVAVEAARAVQDLMKQGDLILVKASRAVGLEKVVEEIKSYE